MNNESEKPTLAKWKTPAIHLTAMTLVWLASLLIVNPIGNFPLNDDWSFGLAVKHLLETGDFRPTGWTSMPLVTNALWGSLFCLPGGFSFTALRVSTLVASWLGMAGVYLLMLELRQAPVLALLTAATLAVNPIYYALSNTFMTDVLYTTLTVYAAIYFVRCLKDDSDAALVAGTALSLAATLSRQTGLAAPLAFGVVLVLRRGWGWRIILRAVGPVILCVIALVTLQYWLAATGRMPTLYNEKSKTLVETIWNLDGHGPTLAGNALVSLVYLGLFLSPILILSGIWRTKKESAALGILFLIFAALVVVHGKAGHGIVMPISVNVMDRAGIGPFTLPDVFPHRPDWVPALPVYFWAAVTIISLAGAAVLLMRLGLLARALWPGLWPAKLGGQESAGVFLLLTSAIYLLPLLSDLLDRYLIPVIPLLAAGILSLSPPAQPATPGRCFPKAAWLLAGFLVFSICGTRDYLAWNRIRWQALNDLTDRQHIPPAKIDGGFEFDGYHYYLARYEGNSEELGGYTDQVTFSQIPGWAVTKEYHFSHWMPPYIGSIFVLENDQQTHSISGAGQ